MIDEVESNNLNENPTSISTISRTEIAAGLGQKNNYFNGYLAKSLTLSSQDIDKQLQPNGIVCLVQPNEIIVKGKGDEHRAILVYKDQGRFKRIELTANTKIDSNIRPEQAFVITATHNFFGQEFYGADKNFPGDDFDSVILNELNTEEFNQYTLLQKIERLQQKAIKRNNYINGYRKANQTDNSDMTVCMMRCIPGAISGIVSNHKVKQLHENLMFQAALNRMNSIVNNNKKDRNEKIWAIQEFYHVYVQLPFWRRHSYILTLIACVAIGLVVGGLFGGPLFLPALILKTAHAAAVEGMMMSFVGGATLLGLHSAYHYYQFKHKSPDDIKNQAIEDAKTYPSPSV